MKSYLWIVPVLLAAGFGYWIFDSTKKIDSLREDLQTAKTQMNSTDNRTAPASSPNGKTPADSALSTRIGKSGAMDWKAISSMMEQINSGADSAALDEMYETMLGRLEAMSQSELYAALDEIAGLGLSKERQSELEAEVVTNLMVKDPEGVLQRFDDRVGNDDDDVGWILAEAVAHMAEKDPAAAVRWMDAKIKEGKFDSKSLDGYSESRVEYESVLMSHLLGTPGGVAVARLEALPASDRLDVLEQMDLTQLSPAAQSQYVEILRTLVPEEDREGAFGYVASELVYEGGFQAVDDFINRVNATPAERSEAAQEAALGRMLVLSEERAIQAADVEELRTWLQGHVPADVDRLTGESIGEAYDEEGYVSFEQAKELALSYHEKSSGDDVLAGFLRSYAASENPQEAGKLLNLIKDPELRGELAKELDL